MNRLDKLLSISTESLIDPAPSSPEPFDRRGSLGRQLFSMLRQTNGSYAFESALHVFPSGTGRDPMTLEAWNAQDLWRYEYRNQMADYLFFAEDVFGNQFGILNDAIYRVDAETGAGEVLAKSIEEWAAAILDDFPNLTGHTLAHEWQVRNGALPIGRRLMPTALFILGGEYEVANLFAVEAVEGMSFRGNFAWQIKDYPDGTKINIDIVP